MPDRVSLTPLPPAYVGRIVEADGWRRRGALVEARRIVEAALHADPYVADLHDALARVLADAGELQLARDAWETALALEPAHPGALKGLGFLAFRQGDLAAAEGRLAAAAVNAPADAGVRAALERVRATRLAPPRSPLANRESRESAAAVDGPTDAPARGVIAMRLGPLPPPVDEAGLEPRPAGAVAGDIRLVCDIEGLVIAGNLGGADGAMTRSHAACELSALAAIVARACEYLALGEWHLCLLDGDRAACAMGRVGTSGLVLTDARGEAATGRVLAALPGAVGRAARWIGEAP